MSNNTYTGKRSRTKLLALLAAMMLCFVGKASAENVVSIEDFTIEPGRDKTVAISLDNTDLISSLEMEIQLPDGISYVDGSVARNPERITQNTHMVYMDPQGDNTYKLWVLANGQTDIQGDTGELVYITLHAAETFSAGGNINVYDILGSSSHAPEGSVETPSYDIRSFDVRVTPYVGKLYITEDTMAIKTDGTTRKVSVALDNYIDVRNFQLDITLPEGLAIETDEAGNAMFEYAGRMPQELALTSRVQEDGALRVSAVGLTTNVIPAIEEGSTADATIFSFNVKADETLPLKSEIAFSNVIVSSNSAASYLVDDLSGMEITNSYIAHYTPANDSIQALRTMYDETVAEIETVAPDVKDSEAITAGKTAIETSIADLQAAVDEAYNDYTLAPNYDEVLSPAEGIIAAIEKLLQDAISAQEGHDLTGSKLYVTEDTMAIKTDGTPRTITVAFEKAVDVLGLTADIVLPEGLSVATDENGNALFEAGSNMPQDVTITSSVQDDGTLRVTVASASEAIAQAADTVFTFNVLADETLPLKSELTFANVAVTGNTGASYVLADVKGIELTNSFLAHYTPANDSIQALRDMYDETLAEIEEVAPDVKDDATLTAQKEDIEKMLADLREAVDAAYDDYTLAQEYDEVLSPSADIIAAIEKLLEDAKDLQEKHDMETGISGVGTTADGEAPVKIYTMSGVQVDAPVKGQVNIVKYADGTVKKVYVK